MSLNLNWIIQHNNSLIKPLLSDIPLILEEYNNKHMHQQQVPVPQLNQDTKKITPIAQFVIGTSVQNQSNLIVLYAF